MKAVMLALFLALLAQGEDMFFKLSELPSQPEVKWLNTNEVAVQMVASGRQVKLASESDEPVGFSNLPVITATEWTTEEEIIRMAGRRQVNLTYAGDQPKPGFPDRLGFGTRAELRDFIVSIRGMGLNVWLTLEYQKVTGGYFQFKVGRFSEGYISFDDMCEDTVAGWNVLVEQLKQKDDYKAGTPVNAQVVISYFNDNNNILPKPFGLVLVRKQGTRDVLKGEQIVKTFASFEESDKEVMVAPFPEIKRFELQLQLTNNVIATMTWTKETGPILASSWPKDSPERVKEQYISISGWLCYGDHPLRMTITATNGDKETYTGRGDRLSMPMVVSLEDRDTMVIDGPMGAIYDVQSTTNLVSWDHRGSVLDVTGRVFLDFPNQGGPLMVFRAVAR